MEFRDRHSIEAALKAFGFAEKFCRKTAKELTEKMNLHPSWPDWWIDGQVARIIREQIKAIRCGRQVRRGEVNLDWLNRREARRGSNSSGWREIPAEEIKNDRTEIKMDVGQWTSL